MLVDPRVLNSSMIRIVKEGIDTAPLLEAIEARSDLFCMCVARQAYNGSPHADTSAIFLRGPMGWDKEWYQNHNGAMDYPALHLLWEPVQKVIKPAIESLGLAELGRVMLVILYPGGKVTKHVDQGAYSDYFQRWHLVLSGGPKAGLRCGSQTVESIPGRLFWFDHKQEHEAWNNEEFPRIHAIIDGVVKANSPEVS